jgi:hypothetical protein
MLSSMRRSLALAAVAILGAGYSVTALTEPPALVAAAPRPVRAGKRSLFGGVRGSAGLFGRKGAGVSVAQGKRASRKARNVARNRANHR